MTAATTAPSTGAGAFPANRFHVSFSHALRTEWIKFRSLRSTVWTLAITVVVMVGFAAMFAAIARSEYNSGNLDVPGFTSTDVVTVGVSFAQLAIAVLGVLIVTNEYSTGMIRSTFSVVPRRVPAVLAKALLITVATFVVIAVAMALSVLVALPLVSGTPAALDLGDGTTVRVLVGSCLYLSMIALLSLGVGTLLRNTAGSIFTLVACCSCCPASSRACRPSGSAPSRSTCRRPVAPRSCWRAPERVSPRGRGSACSWSGPWCPSSGLSSSSGTGTSDRSRAPRGPSQHLSGAGRARVAPAGRSQRLLSDTTPDSQHPGS